MLQRPYFARAHLPYPALGVRLALVAGQMLAYHERFPPTGAKLALYKALVDEHGSCLDGAFRASIAREFVAAVKELGETTADDVRRRDAGGALVTVDEEEDGSSDGALLDTVRGRRFLGA